MMVITIS